MIFKQYLDWFVNTDLFSHYQTEINKENRTAITLLSIAGLPVTGGVMITQLIVSGISVAYYGSFLLFFYFLSLILFDRFLLPSNYKHSTAMLYIVEVPVMIICILLGTVWDTENPVITFLLFSLIIPAFVLDYPLRSLLIQGAWSLLCIALCFVVKETGLARRDAIHLLSFYIGAAALTNVTLRIRLASLRRLGEVEYNLTHDVDTGCLNRYALHGQKESYFNTSLTVLLADMDQFMLFNDFYGHEAGEAIMHFFTHTLMDCFGQMNTYHYRGDEFLCMIEGEDVKTCLEKIDNCRQKLHNFRLNEKKLPLTCAFGYVTGVPESEESFLQMIQLADIYAHKAKKAGQNGTEGDYFDEAHLRQGILASNLSTHARSFEVNQLTGLPVMSYFVSRSDAILNNIVDVKRQPVIGCIKLMNMRAFNNAYNYSGGDELIAKMARLLETHFTDRSLCYIAAAQFGVMCYEDEVNEAIRQINEELKVYKPGFPVECKAGFARYTEDESVISLMDKAKLALKNILKKSDSWCFYDTELDQELYFREYLVTHLDEAVEKGYLKVYYQPIARAITGHVCNEEALSRWDDPKYGFLTPYRFIPVLEEHELIYKVTLHVVRQVLLDFKTKEELGVPIVPVSVNLSRTDFEGRDMVQMITDLVDESGYPRSMIKIEITESAFTKESELLSREVSRFRANGFEVWLDDFGSEYSTLNLLQEIDFDLIKIDMQFMKNLSTSGKNFIIVSDIIDMAKKMGITTLIEGVETPEHFRIMKRMGCEKIQGYLFNKPNELSYITARAITHTGLTFENPNSVPYYEAIGRIDLNEPLSSDGIELLDNRKIPAGILEYRNHRFVCLRATDPFLRMLSGWGFISKDNDSVKRTPISGSLPEEFLREVDNCMSNTAWNNFSVDTTAEGALNVYIRRVTEKYDGSIALLVVLLHNKSQASAGSKRT